MCALLVYVIYTYIGIHKPYTYTYTYFFCLNAEVHDPSFSLNIVLQAPMTSHSCVPVLLHYFPSNSRLIHLYICVYMYVCMYIQDRRARTVRTLLFSNHSRTYMYNCGYYQENIGNV